MTNEKWSVTEHIIVDFLNQHPSPTSDDWKQLTDRFPMHANAIADAAMVHSAGDAADAYGEIFEVDDELANRTISNALNKIHQTASANLDKARSKVESIKKPADRKQTAILVGIGPYPSLLNGILSGRTRVPSKVLDALADMVKVPRLALVELFRRNFEGHPIPSFKGGGRKPEISTRPATWKEAVNGLNLSKEETTRLLELERED